MVRCNERRSMIVLHRRHSVYSIGPSVITENVKSWPTFLHALECGKKPRTCTRPSTVVKTCINDYSCYMTEHIVCSHLFNRIIENGSITMYAGNRASRCIHNESAIVLAGRHLAARKGKSLPFFIISPMSEKRANGEWQKAVCRGASDKHLKNKTTSDLSLTITG